MNLIKEFSHTGKYKVNVISRIDSTRRESIKNHLDELGVSFEFLDAADKTNIKRDHLVFSHKDYNLKITESSYWGSFKTRGWFKIGEVGCFMSHYILWNKLLNDNCEYYLILEDDAFLTFNNEILTNFFQSELPKIDLIYCQSVSPNFPNGKKIFNTINVEQLTAIPNGYYDLQLIEGTTGYILSKTGAQKLVEKVKELGCIMPVDNFIGIVASEIMNSFICPNYLTLIMANYWKNTEIHHEVKEEKSLLLDGMIFKYE